MVTMQNITKYPNIQGSSSQNNKSELNYHSDGLNRDKDKPVFTLQYSLKNNTGEKNRSDDLIFLRWQSTWAPRNDHNNDQRIQQDCYPIFPFTRTGLITKVLESLNLYSHDEKQCTKMKNQIIDQKAYLMCLKNLQKITKLLSKISRS